MTVAVGGIVGIIRQQETKRIEILEHTLDKVQTDIADKAHKDEVTRIETRFDRDIADLRQDQKNGFAEIRQDLKDFRNDMIALFSSRDK